MSSSHPAFRLYYRLVAALQRALRPGADDRARAGPGAGRLRLGLEIGEVARAVAARPPHGAAAPAEPGDLAARPVRARGVRAGELDELAAALDAIASGAADAPDVRHSMRQLVLMKQPGV